MFTKTCKPKEKNERRKEMPVSHICSIPKRMQIVTNLSAQQRFANAYRTLYELFTRYNKQIITVVQRADQQIFQNMIQYIISITGYHSKSAPQVVSLTQETRPKPRRSILTTLTSFYNDYKLLKRPSTLLEKTIRTLI
jgi:endonuclease III